MKSLKEFVSETKVSAEVEFNFIDYLIDIVNNAKNEKWAIDKVSTILTNVGYKLNKEGKYFDAFNKGVEQYLKNAKDKFRDFDDISNYEEINF